MLKTKAVQQKTGSELTMVSDRVGLRSIATFEAAKGLIVLLVGFGLLSLAHRDLQQLGEQFVEHLHLNPAHEFPQIFLRTLEKIQNMNFLLLAIGASLYSALRFTEAYGLWFDRAWAEWMAILSTGLYLPVEIYDLWLKRSAVTLVITLFNAALLFYLFKVRRAKLLSAALSG